MSTNGNASNGSDKIGQGGGSANGSSFGEPLNSLGSPDQGTNVGSSGGSGGSSGGGNGTLLGDDGGTDKNDDHSDSHAAQSSMFSMLYQMLRSLALDPRTLLVMVSVLSYKWLITRHPTKQPTHSEVNTDDYAEAQERLLGELELYLNESAPEQAKALLLDAAQEHSHGSIKKSSALAHLWHRFCIPFGNKHLADLNEKTVRLR